jgi:hypothetical protein
MWIVKVALNRPYTFIVLALQSRLVEGWPGYPKPLKNTR